MQPLVGRRRPGRGPRRASTSRGPGRTGCAGAPQQRRPVGRRARQRGAAGRWRASRLAGSSPCRWSWPGRNDRVPAAPPGRPVGQVGAQQPAATARSDPSPRLDPGWGLPAQRQCRGEQAAQPVAAPGVRDTAEHVYQDLLGVLSGRHGMRSRCTRLASLVQASTARTTPLQSPK